MECGRSLVPLAFAVLLLGTSSGAAAPDWQTASGTLVEVPEASPLAAILPAQPLPPPDGEFLFGAGRGTSYEVEVDGTLRLRLGRKKTVEVAPGEAFKVPVLYPGESSPFTLPFRRLAAGDPTVPAYRAGAVVAVKLGKRALTFLDLDANGYFDDPFVDAVYDGAPEATAREAADPEALRARLRPFQGWIEVGDRRFLATLRPAPQLRLWPVGAAVREDTLRHMGLLNHLRRQGGLPPIGLDESLTEACERHSAYCAKNGLCHEEDPAKPGYTPEGDRAGRSAVVGTHDDAEAGLRGMFRTLYHRTYFLWPLLSKVGVGVKDGHYTCDVLSHVDTSAREPIAYPFDRQTGVETVGGSEWPDPRPADLEALAGTFVVLAFQKGSRPTLVDASLRTVRGGVAVPFATSTPGAPPPAATERFPDNDATICLYPRAALEPETTYEARIVYTDGAGAKAPISRVWRFRTAP